MIWALLFISAIICALYLSAPFLKTKTLIPIGLSVIFVCATALIYTLIGEPALSAKANLTFSTDKSDAANTLPQGVNPQDVTPADINAMVDGLAARLEDEPEDIDGWTRLLRARVVLGDIPKLIETHKAMRAAFTDSPDTIELISQNSGFNEFVTRIAREQNASENP